MADWNVGQRITATRLTNAFPLASSKLADTSKSSTTTVAADPDLALPGEASRVYVVRASLLYSGNATPDIKFTWFAPTGATMANWRYLGNGTGGEALSARGIASTLTTEVFQACDGSDDAFDMWGTLTMGSTAGDFGVAWAQNSSSASACTVKATSNIYAIRVPA